MIFIFFADFDCANCVLQWRYIAGNNWGMCPDGTGAVGCGAQEEFRACSDINIGDVGPQPPLRPLKPATKATTKSTSTMRTTDVSGEVEATATEETAPLYLGLLISLISLLAVLCMLVAIYLYNYHGQRIKQLLHWNKDHKASKQAADITTHTNATLPPPPSTVAPVPPPRTKRLSQSLHDIEANESSVLS